MSCCESNSHHVGAAGKLQAPKRNHYYFSKMMDVLQFDMEQAYGMQHRMLTNRLAVGTGVLCGLGVEVDDKLLCVNAGVAFDHVGHQVIVPGRYCIDPWHVPGECGKPHEDRARGKAHKVTLCLGYHECHADYAPVMVTDCRNEQACEAGSVVESFKLWVRDGWPDPRADFCEALNEQGASYELVATIDTGGAPRMVAVAGNGKRAVVLNDVSKPVIQVIDLASNSVIKEFPGKLSAPLGGVSVAPDGGHALVTHAKGIVVVDLQSDPPAIVDAFNTQKNYGRCVATHAGARLYAIAGDKVYRIDIASKTEKAILSGHKPDDLAVSSDNASLFVSDASNKNMILVETASDTEVWKKPLAAPGDALAATGGAGDTTAWSITASQIRRFDGSGAAQDSTVTLAPIDAAFSSDGRHNYIVHKAGSASSEVVILDGADTKELARVALDAGSTTIATVPKRARAVITHVDAGKVSVIDAIDLRTRLCRMLSGPCPAPDEKPCIVLATVELSADGTIGNVDACSFRTRLLSNELLLELILCLAERQDACCGGDEVKQPEPPPPPPVEEALMKVARVEFLRADGQVAKVLSNPNDPVQLSARTRISAIRFHFTQPVDATTVISPGFNDDPAKFSLLVWGGSSPLPSGIIPGATTPDGTHAMLFTVHPEIGAFGRGDYKVVLFGDKDTAGQRPAAAGIDGRRLDGEPLGLPSGNNSEGGNFKFAFIVG